MITVIGAANVDITASPIGRYVPCDSNPSRVEISYGGVGRNIAHNLCLMGEKVRLFTVFGFTVTMYMVNKALSTVLVMIWNYFTKRAILKNGLFMKKK